VTPVGTAFIQQAEAVALLFAARSNNAPDGAFLDLVSSGNSTVDASSAIAAIVDFEAPPVAGPRGVLADLLDLLRRMGVNARPALLGELLAEVEFAARYESFAVDGAVDARDPRSAGLTVDRRLFQDAVFSFIATAEDLGIVPRRDSDPAEIEARYSEHRSLIEQALADYRSANGIDGDLTDDQLLAVRESILAREADDATRQSFEGFATMVQQLDQLGLTLRETDRVHATMLDPVLPTELDRRAMLLMLRGR
jgi:hypothetical protein